MTSALLYARVSNNRLRNAGSSIRVISRKVKLPKSSIMRVLSENESTRTLSQKRVRKIKS